MTDRKERALRFAKARAYIRKQFKHEPETRRALLELAYELQASQEKDAELHSWQKDDPPDPPENLGEPMDTKDFRLDRYDGQEPKYKVLRRMDDASYKEVDPPSEHFVLKLRDLHAAAALEAYARSATYYGQHQLAADVKKLADEARTRGDLKLPD
jgi:hypothetical protein